MQFQKRKRFIKSRIINKYSTKRSKQLIGGKPGKNKINEYSYNNLYINLKKIFLNYIYNNINL